MQTLTLFATLLPVGSAIVGVVIFFRDLRKDQREILAVGRKMLTVMNELKEVLERGTRR